MIYLSHITESQSVLRVMTTDYDRDFRETVKMIPPLENSKTVIGILSIIIGVD
jgi:hypothetical protein